jgi:hypothetical protein
MQSGDMIGDLIQGSLCHEQFNHESGNVIQDGDPASHDVTSYDDSTEDSVAQFACKQRIIVLLGSRSNRRPTNSSVTGLNVAVFKSQIVIFFKLIIHASSVLWCVLTKV